MNTICISWLIIVACIYNINMLFIYKTLAKGAMCLSRYKKRQTKEIIQIKGFSMEFVKIWYFIVEIVQR